MMKLNIAMATEGLEFTGDTLNYQALGGSETAFICVAREFARMGHHVRAYCKCTQEGEFDGVKYFDISRIKEQAELGECDVLIISRFMQYFGIKFNSKLNILWNHDILMDVDMLTSYVWNIDYMYCLSQFHKEQYAKKLPDYAPMIKIIPNGIDPELLPANKIEKLHRIMFTSRPERGLFRALEIYESLGDKTLEFIACNYETLQNDQVIQIEQLCEDKMIALKNSGYDIKWESYPKKELYAEIAKAKCVIYPTEFPEIFCISAIEAQACGTVFLSVDKYALKETVGYEGVATNEEFLSELKKIISDDNYRSELEELGINHVRAYTWELVAEKMVMDAMAHFKKRAEDKEGVILRLMYNSDYVVAREACVGVNSALYAENCHALRYVDKKVDYKELYEDESTHEVIDMDFDTIKTNTRFRWLATKVQQLGAKTLLDYACHMGGSTLITNRRLPDLVVTGYDISESAISKAKTRLSVAGNPDNVKLTSNEADIKGKQYDVVFCGELIEHVLDPEKLVDELEKYVAPNGTILFTIPKGAWEYLSHDQAMARGSVFHVNHFEYWDLIGMFGNKKDFTVETIACFPGSYDESLGNYMISYKPDGTPTGQRDIARKLLMTRPHQTITACIIAKDAEKEIETMIESIHFEMDEIIVGIDPASMDCTEARLAKYPKVKTFLMPQSIQGPDFWGFSNARNWVLEKATSKWILWIDSDEKLIAREKFRKFLENDLINAFVVKQHHCQFDNFILADNPQRLFRRGHGQFVGYIHEQAQSIHDINEPIGPALIMNGMDIVNFGELTEGMRRDKAVGRNLQLLKVDVRENVDKRAKSGLPIRKLSIILLMRDFYNRIRWNIEKFKTAQTRDTLEMCLPKIRGLYNKYFAHETDKMYKELAVGILQNAYDEMGIGQKIEIEFNGKKFKRRIADRDDFAALLMEMESALKLGLNEEDDDDDDSFYNGLKRGLFDCASIA